MSGTGGSERRRPATAVEVAKLAGVSQSAVSRTFTPGASVAPAMRERVEAAARRLGYRPNLIARSLITRRSNIVGVVVGYMENQFYPEMLRALSARLSASGYRILLFTTDRTEDSDPVLDEILHYRVDALVLASATLSSHLAGECREAGLPVVLVNRRTAEAGVSSVTGDNARGGAAIADFLVAGRHARLAYIAGIEDSSTSQEREAGFAGRLAELGAPPPRREVGGYDFQTAYARTLDLLDGPDRPDAVFCANDHTAFAAIEAARRRGLEVGRDVSIVGFDNTSVAAWPSFDLTTYSQPIPRMAEEVGAMIEALTTTTSAEAFDVVVPGELIVRSSARLP